MDDKKAIADFSSDRIIDSLSLPFNNVDKKPNEQSTIIIATKQCMRTKYDHHVDINISINQAEKNAAKTNTATSPENASDI